MVSGLLLYTGSGEKERRKERKNERKKEWKRTGMTFVKTGVSWGTQNEERTKPVLGEKKRDEHAQIKRTEFHYLMKVVVTAHCKKLVVVV